MFFFITVFYKQFAITALFQPLEKIMMQEPVARAEWINVLGTSVSTEIVLKIIQYRKAIFVLFGK